LRNCQTDPTSKISTESVGTTCRQALVSKNDVRAFGFGDKSVTFVIKGPEFRGSCATPNSGQAHEPRSLQMSLTMECNCSTHQFPSSRRQLAAQNVTDGPYLQSVGQTSAKVVWRQTASDIGVVMIGTSSSSLKTKFVTSSTTRDPVVTLTGLKANTKYFYSIGGPSVTLMSGKSLFFSTLPTLGSSKSARFLMVGDPGSGATLQYQVLNATRKYLSSTKAANAWFLLGDNAYDDGTDSEYSKKVFQVYQDDLKSVPMYAIIGNHDKSKLSASGTESGPYFQRFITPRNGEGGGVPSGSGLYYSLDFGNIHIVCLDSYLNDDNEGSPMRAWLAQDLSALKTNVTEWLIALWHHPPYSKGGLDSDSDSRMRSFREDILPVVEAAGVDLVIGGHSHNYERSLFLNGHYGKSSSFDASRMVVPRGTGSPSDPHLKPLGIVPNQGMVSVVTGSAGKLDTSPAGLDHEANVYFPGSRKNGLILGGTFIVDVSGGELIGQFLAANGSIMDKFVIQKKATVPVLASPSPQLTATSSPSPSASESPSRTASKVPSVTPTVSLSVGLGSPSSSHTPGFGGSEADANAGSESDGHTFGTTTVEIIVIAVGGSVGLCALAVVWAGMAYRFKRRSTAHFRAQTKTGRRQSSSHASLREDQVPSSLVQPQHPRYTRLSAVGSPTRPTTPAAAMPKILTSPEPVRTPAQASHSRFNRESLSFDLRRRQRRSTSGVLRASWNKHNNFSSFSTDSEDMGIEDADSASVIPVAGTFGPGSMPGSSSSRVAQSLLSNPHSAPIILEGQRKHRSRSQSSKKKVLAQGRSL
jgi:Calcineurin-like phosphoesterase